MSKFFETIQRWCMKWFKKKVEKPEPDNALPTEPKEETEPLGEVVCINNIVWRGDNYAGAKINARLSGGWLSNDKFHMNDSAPNSWPIKKEEKKDKNGNVIQLLQGIVCLFYEENGKITGGKFDWLRPNQTDKGLENVHEGYRGHKFPVAGARCFAMFVSVDESLRSNIAELIRK